MTYRLKYNVYVLYTEPGRGANGTQLQAKDTVLEFFDTASAIVGTTTFTNADIVTLLNAMVADLTAQLEVPATQTRIQNWGANTFPATL